MDSEETIIKKSWKADFVGLAIPVLASGGAIPVVIGILGASSCTKTACAVRGLTIAKVINCIFVTVFCWIIWLGLIMMLISAQG